MQCSSREIDALAPGLVHLSDAARIYYVSPSLHFPPFLAFFLAVFPVPSPSTLHHLNVYYLPNVSAAIMTPSLYLMASTLVPVTTGSCVCVTGKCLFLCFNSCCTVAKEGKSVYGLCSGLPHVEGWDDGVGMFLATFVSWVGGEGSWWRWSVKLGKVHADEESNNHKQRHTKLNIHANQLGEKRAKFYSRGIAPYTNKYAIARSPPPSNSKICASVTGVTLSSSYLYHSPFSLAQAM